MSFSMNGNILLDTLCLPNEEGCRSATEYDQMFPFFLVKESENAYLLSGIDGFLGLSPSKTKGFKSYGQFLKDSKLIDVDAVSFSEKNNAIEVTLGEFNTSAPQFAYTIVINTTTTEDR